MADLGALGKLGWDDRVAARFEQIAGDDREPARIVRVERGGGLGATAQGEVLTTSRAPLAVGDWVAVRHLDEAPEVVGRVERWSELTRRDPLGRTQVLAANLDIVLIAAPADRLSVSRVEREVAVAWDGGARPIVLLTKCDLADPTTETSLRERLQGTEIVATSSISGQGLEQVAEALRPARTAVLLGPSGAGKSSIANRLLGYDRMEVGAVREGDHRGRHTTSVRQLLVVPTGGCLIDTPGLRSLSLAEDHGGVAAAFPDIAELASSCRFDDCAHDREPGCAVLAAVEAGTLDPRRLANSRKLEAELQFEARRDDPRAAAAAELVWKRRAKARRRLPRDR